MTKYQEIENFINDLQKNQQDVISKMAPSNSSISG